MIAFDVLFHDRHRDSLHNVRTHSHQGLLQIRRCQGIAVDHYGFTLGALALKPSDFCNTGVNSRRVTNGFRTHLAGRIEMLEKPWT